MTISYKLDLSLSLTENVKRINDLLDEEMEQYKDSRNHNVRQRLSLSISDYAVLCSCFNNFGSIYTDTLRKEWPKLEFHLLGQIDFDYVAAVVETHNR